MAKKPTVLIIGFGEAGRAIAAGWHSAKCDLNVLTYDILLDDPAKGDEMRIAASTVGVKSVAHDAEAFEGVGHVLSLVTADQALDVAQRAAGVMQPGAVFWDMNSVAPETKRTAGAALEAVGVTYLDVGILSPIHPKRHKAPMAFSGAVDATLRAAIKAFGFEADILSERIGDAAALKLMRSIVIKGIEALLVECDAAGAATGLTDKVLETLAPSFPGVDWPKRMEYTLERVQNHGDRRAAEMEEATRFLQDLGTPCEMSRSAAKTLRHLAK